MDEIDKTILNQLKTNARTSIKDLAEMVKLSSPATSSRIEKLEKEKIIDGYHMSLDYENIGYTIKAYINLSLPPTLKPEFYPYINSCSNVLECDCVTGDYSILMKVLFKTTVELDQFINELQRFGPTQTQIVFSTPVKYREIDIKIL